MFSFTEHVNTTISNHCTPQLTCTLKYMLITYTTRRFRKNKLNLKVFCQFSCLKLVWRPSRHTFTCRLKVYLQIERLDVRENSRQPLAKNILRSIIFLPFWLLIGQGFLWGTPSNCLSLYLTRVLCNWLWFLCCWSSTWNCWIKIKF